MNILETDLTGVDPSYALLPVDAYQFKVKECTLAKTKDGVGDMIVVKLALDQKAKDTKGRDVFPGWVCTDRISLTPTETYDEEAVKKRVRSFQLAIFKESECPGRVAPLDQYVGRTLNAKLKIKIDNKGQYPDANQVSAYISKE